MSIDAAIATWGLPALVLGGLFEGDTMGILGGAAAHRGIVGFWPAAGALGLGAALADQAWFHAARAGRDRRFFTHIAARPAGARLLAMVSTRPVLAAAAFRFLPGTRTVGPVVLGLSSVPRRVYVPVNLVAIMVWSVLVTAAGYGGGQLLQGLTGGLALHLHLGIVLAVCLAAAAAWLVLR